MNELLKRVFIFTVSATIIFSCSEEENKQADYGLVIHGGAGSIYEGRYTPEEEAEYQEKLKEALLAGHQILKDNGTAIDAVESVIRILEDSPLFNAGKGAVFTNNGVNELDASIMDGKTLNAGAVARVKQIKNPISLARLVMDQSSHVLMAGDGAEIFAQEQGIELVETDYFFTENKWESLQKMQAEERKKNNPDESSISLSSEQKFGTVGCAALDRNGNLAAGTSTGGIMGKRFGRVGDSPIIGAGTYANNKTCAVSATGQGEYFIRNVVTHDISAIMEYKKLSLNEAANMAMKKLKELDGTGGVIAIDKNGNIAMPFNTKGMFRGYMLDENNPIVLLYK